MTMKKKQKKKNKLFITPVQDYTIPEKPEFTYLVLRDCEIVFHTLSKRLALEFKENDYEVYEVREL